MSPRPRLSLCIPTWNRSRYLQGALESGLREAASQPPGTIEVLVCDNASSDETPEVIAKIRAAHPELRTFRNDENIGFDRNYLRCVEEAHGEFVWILGDDDEWRPGSISRVLHELEIGAEACLCLAETCDMDLNPISVHPCFLDPHPPSVWRLETQADRIAYFNACARNAGVFGFISVAIFERDRFLENMEGLHQSVGTGYIHVWGMMASLRRSLRLHYIGEALVLNRTNFDETNGGDNFFGRWIIDLKGWATIADALFKDEPETHLAFSRIVGRNHLNNLPGIRWSAPTDADWELVVPFLLRAGFTPVRLAAVNYAYQHLYCDRLAMPTLNPTSLCIVDLPILVRGSRRIVVMALGGRQSLQESAPVIAALRKNGFDKKIQIFCTSECTDLLDGFELWTVELGRYSREIAYRKFLTQVMADIAPELVLNLDRQRGIQADDLVAEACPAGAIAFELPLRGQNDNLVKALNNPYTCLIAQDAAAEAFLDALGWDLVQPDHCSAQIDGLVPVLRGEGHFPSSLPSFRGRRKFFKIRKKNAKE